MVRVCNEREIEDLNNFEIKEEAYRSTIDKIFKKLTAEIESLVQESNLEPRQSEQ